MYTDFYQLTKTPFPIASDPDSFYLFPDHKTALGCLVHGIESRLGCVMVTGEAGLGKTALMHTYVARADPEIVKTVCLWHANVTFADLLHALLEALECDHDSDNTAEMQLKLHEALLHEAGCGRTVALLIDEAQTMPIDTLVKLRLLLNLETETQKLLQIVLIGLPRLFVMLRQDELRPLRQHTMLHGELKPLTQRESLTYLQDRLAEAADNAEPILTRQALRRLARAAKGNPRMLNILSTNTLIEGMNAQEKPITARTAKRVIQTATGRREARRWWYGLGYASAVAALVFLLVRTAPVPWPTLGFFFRGLPHFKLRLRSQLRRKNRERFKQMSRSKRQPRRKKRKHRLSLTRRSISTPSPRLSPLRFQSKLPHVLGKPLPICAWKSMGLSMPPC